MAFGINCFVAVAAFEKYVTFVTFLDSGDRQFFLNHAAVKKC